MPSVTKTLRVPFSASQMYALIDNVELYPQFLPWCRRAIVHNRHEHELAASLEIGRGLINHTLSTVNKMIPGSQISMEYRAGPFKTCSGFWSFKPAENATGCEINFSMTYEFNNKLQALALEPFFKSMSNTLIDAFYDRAVQLYGK